MRIRHRDNILVGMEKSVILTEIVNGMGHNNMGGHPQELKLY